MLYPLGLKRRIFHFGEGIACMYPYFFGGPGRAWGGRARRPALRAEGTGCRQVRCTIANFAFGRLLPD